MWDVIVLILDHCLSIYFKYKNLTHTYVGVYNTNFKVRDLISDQQQRRSTNLLKVRSKPSNISDGSI